MLRRLLALPLGFPRLTLAVMVVLTAFFGFFAASIKVDSSIENLLPADDPDKRYYEGVKAVFGDEEVTVIGVFADDVFTPATLAKIDLLSSRLAEIDGVREVLSLATVKTVEVNDFGLSTGKLMRAVPRTAEEAAALRAAALANPLYVKNIVSADGRAAGITVTFEPMSDEEFLGRGIEERIRALVDELRGPETFAITGIPTIKVNGARLMESDVAKFTPLSLLLIVIVLAFAFRTVRGVLIPLAAVVVGVVWTNGVMVLAGSAINMGTLVLNPLLMVVGIASGIHIVSTYYLEHRPDRSRTELVRVTMDDVRIPVLIAATTTLIGFATLIFTPIPAVREFGIYSVLGIAIIILASFTVIPAALSLLPLPKTVQATSQEPDRIARLLERVGEYSVRHRRAVLACSLVVLLVAVWGIGRIRVETDYIGFFSAESTIRKDNALIAERLAGTQPIYVVVDGAAPQSAVQLETLTALSELQRFIDRQPGVDKTISLLDYLTLVRRALRPDAAEPLPKDQSEVDQILLLINPKDVHALLNRDASRTNIIVRTRLSSSSEVGEFVRRVEEFAAAHFPGTTSVRATGTVVLLNRSADALAWGQVIGLWQELLVLLGLLSFLFLSVRVGIMALIPNVVPIVILFGIMGWSGISLNISTSMIAAIAIGIAIDDTIHLLTTFNAGLRKTGSQERAVVMAMTSAGLAAFFISTALAAGFLIVCLSNFEPVRHFGMLSAATMAVALATELFLSPALVTTTKIITLWDLLFLKLGPEPHKQIPLFEGLRPIQAKIVVLTGHLANATRGTHLARAGELRPELYVLLGGRAEVRGADGVLLRSLARGDVVGEMGFVRKRPRSADVVVTDDTEYLVLDQSFARRLRRYPRIASTVFLNLSRILSDRLERTTEQLAPSPKDRLASARA